MIGLLKKIGPGRWIVISIISTVFLVVAYSQIMVRMPEARASSGHHQVELDFQSIERNLATHLSENRLPDTHRIEDAAMVKAGGSPYLFFSREDPLLEFSDPFSPGREHPYAWDEQGLTGLIISPGPDERYNQHPDLWLLNESTMESPEIITRSYDSSNGTFSQGDMYRIVKFRGSE